MAGPASVCRATSKFLGREMFCVSNIVRASFTRVKAPRKTGLVLKLSILVF